MAGSIREQFFERIGAGVPATLSGAAAAAIFYFAVGGTALLALATFAATITTVGAIQFTRGWLAKRAFYKLRNDKQICKNHTSGDFFTKKTASETTKRGFSRGWDAEGSWSIYLSSPFLTYFGTLTELGHAYQAGRYERARFIQYTTAEKAKQSRKNKP